MLQSPHHPRSPPLDSLQYGGCPIRTARSLCSFPPPSLACQSSTTDSLYYSLQIPLHKTSAPTTLPAARMVSPVSSDKRKTSATAAKDSPTHHICSSACSLATRGKTSRFHMHSSSYWLLSLPHFFYLPARLPRSLSPSLPFASLYPPLQLGSPLLGSRDSPQQWSNALYVSQLWNFSSPSKHYVPTNPATALPTPPGVSNEIVTIYRLPGFIPAICYPSRYFYCTSGCASSASETAWWGGAENLNKGKR